MSGFRTHVLVVAMLVAAPTIAIAQNQPIKGPEDARCRDEARDTLFSTPNPRGLSPFDFGAELYHACMRRLGAEPEARQRKG